MAQPELPFEIWEQITTTLRHEIDPALLQNSESLKALSLASKFMVPLCQKNLFSSVTLISKKKDNARSSRFKRVITDNPALISYIRIFEYQISNPLHNNGDHEIFHLLSDQSSVLHSISLNCLKEGWDAPRTPLRQAMEKLILLPTLTHITFINLKNVPAHLLGRCARLEYLTLKNVDVFTTGYYELPKFDASPPTPIYLEIHGPHDSLEPLSKERGYKTDERFMDFGGLKKIVADIFYTKRSWYEGTHTEHIWELLQINTALESLELSSGSALFSTYNELIAPICGLDLKPLQDRVLLNGFGAALSTHAISTLKQLSLSMSISVLIDGSDPLCGLVPELAIIARTNILEEISLRLEVGLDLIRQFREDDWDAFDRLLTAPGSFPMLRSVLVEIHWSFRSWDPEYIVDQIMDKRFLAHSNSDTVDFRFSTKRLVHDPFIL